jgi:TatD DNase family protein
MYLHNRNTGEDFYEMVKKNRDRFSTGIVHSFTGGIDEIKQIVDLDLYIGINGCSFKTQENLEALKHIPI